VLLLALFLIFCSVTGFCAIPSTVTIAPSNPKKIIQFRNFGTGATTTFTLSGSDWVPDGYVHNVEACGDHGRLYRL
jgi:hypothetical protein